MQKTILRWVSKNHKATREIKKNVFDELGRLVSDEAFHAALLGLHTTGFVTSYIYDNQSQKYALISSPDEYSIDALYWLAMTEAE